MKNTRRQFIKASALGAAALATGLPAMSSAGSVDKSAEKSRSLSILILGGTGFIGPHMVREALRRGHQVTLFNRGRTNNSLFTDLETIKGDRDNGLQGLEGRSWDAVVDNSGYIPRHVQDSAHLLAANTSRYLYISTVSVYKDFATDNSESSPLATMDDESIEEVSGETYGPLKALCEKRARAEIPSKNLTVIRPTYIAGPGDHTDRFSYWPIRTRAGGEMIWPGSPDDHIQVVDVRDLANFTVHCLENEISGTFNAANPSRSYTLGNLLADSQAVTGATVDPVWISAEFASENGLLGSRALPIWHPRSGEHAVLSSFISKAARGAGFSSRPERETVRDLLAWWDTQSDERRKTLRAGLQADREAALIAKWKTRS